MRLQQFLIGFVLVTMPFFLGGARPWIWPIIAAIFFVGVVILIWRSESADYLSGISKVWMLVFAVLLVYPLLQVIPLPASWLSVLSPTRLAWLERARQIAHLPTWDSISYVPLKTVFEGFIWWLFLVVFALVLNGVLRREGRLDWLFNLLFAFAVFEALYGLMQVLIPTLGVLWEAEGQGLARGTFVNRNNYACFLGMLWPVLLAYVWSMAGAQSSKLKAQRGELSYPERERVAQVRQKQVFFGFMIGLMVFAIFFSRSRGGIIGSVISLTVLMIASKPMRTKGMLFLVIGAWAVMVFYGSIIGFDEIIRRFDDIDIGAEGRFLIWQTGSKIIHDHPLTGTGLGTFIELFRVYQSFLDDEMTFRFAHNDYLQLVLELGAPVAVCMILLVWGYWWNAAWRLAGGRRTEDRGQRAGDRRLEGEKERAGLGITDYGLSGEAQSSKFKAQSNSEYGRQRAEDGEQLNPKSAIRNPQSRIRSERRRLIKVGALAGSAAFLCHSWVEFNWQIPANALYFVMLLVLMNSGEAVRG